MSDAAPPSDSKADAGPVADAYFTALPARGKSIGHTSVVFKLGLDGGLDAAYKPRSHRGGERFRGEIAAYRLAVALGLDNVPPAVARSFPADALRKSLDDQASALFAQEAIVEADGTVRGALIPWISHLAFMPLETAEWRAKWGAWLDASSVGALSDCDADLASQISTMILFDTMTGNWDRWSGGNIGVARATAGGCDRVLFIDNDGAFFDPVPVASAASQLALVQKMQRFSRSFVTILKGTSEMDLAHALGEESSGKPLLPKRVIDAFFARRKTVLAIIDARGDGALSLP